MTTKCLYNALKAEAVEALGINKWVLRHHWNVGRVRQTKMSEVLRHLSTNLYIQDPQ